MSSKAKTSTYRPVKVDITPEMVERAEARDCGQMNKNSFMKGKGNIVGFLGEEIVQSLSPSFIWADTYDYDFIYKKKHTVDVKSKCQTVDYEPKFFYEASVGKDSLHQKTDFYIFCRVFRDKEGNYPYGWVLGFMPKKLYFVKCKKLLKGTVDPSNNFHVRQDCYNLPYFKLFPIKEFLKNPNWDRKGKKKETF